MSKARIIEAMMEKISKSLRVAMPASIVSYDYKTQKASVQIDIKELYGEDDALEYPVISNIPVIFPVSGGASLTMPVKIGDSCLVLFMDRDISSWLFGVNSELPQSSRSHHLNDAVAIMGLNNFTTISKAQNNTDLLLSYSGSDIVLKPNGKIEILNANEVTCSTQELLINCKNANVISTENVSIECKTASIRARNDTSIECLNATLVATENISAECSVANINASSAINTKAPNFIQKGNLRVEGDIEITGKSDIEGALTCNDTIEGNVVKTSAGIDLAQHKHSYQEPIVGSSPTAARPSITGGAQ